MPQKPEVPLPKSKDERVGFAIVGLGKLTVEELMPSMHIGKKAHVAALVTSEEEKGAAFAKALGLTENDVYTYDDFEKVADRDDVEAVLIVLPNKQHREFVERAAAIKKHIFCEKPLGMNSADAQAMVDACNRAGVLLMTAYRCQYTPHHWAMRKAIQDGKIGRVRQINSIHSHVEEDPEAWRLKADLSGGGPLPDIGIYSINTMRFVLGIEPEWVWAVNTDLKDDKRFKEVEEQTAYILGFADGVTATCLTSYNTQKIDQLIVLGDKGLVKMDPAFSYTGNKLTIVDKEGECSPCFKPYDMFMLEIDHFADRVRAGKPAWTPGEEGLQDHRIMDAIQESARTGQKVAIPAPPKKMDAFRGAPPEPPKPDTKS